MKLRFITQSLGKSGQADARTKTFDQERVIIGRGGKSDLVFSSRLVGFEHAVLSESENTLFVDDLGSFSGTRVNDLPVTRRALNPDDVIKCGDLTLKVARDAGGWALLQEIVAQDSQSDRSEELARGLKFESHVPSPRALSVLFVLAVAVIYFAWPVATGQYHSWSSGPISSPHSMIASQCEACHSLPFQQVQDKDCLQCHKLSEHFDPKLALGTPHHSALDKRCAECHFEHNGDARHGSQGMIVRDARLCTECHAAIKTVDPRSTEPDVKNFAEHPQFRVSLADSRGEAQATSGAHMVSLDDRAKLKDPTPLKLNHQIHLKEGLRGEKGPVTLTCLSCHVPDVGHKGRGMIPITFEKNCASCHPLTFDDRLPEKQVPHGNPDVVFNYLYAEYSKLFLSDQGSQAAQIVNSRFRPGGGAQAQAAQEAAVAVKPTREAVETESRKAEDLLFTKTACLLCHEVSKKEGGSSGGTDPLAGVMVSKWQVQTPHIPDLWMTGAVFDHGAHQEVRCESCHEGVRESKVTADVLLPKIAGCRECHVDGAQRDKVNSDCMMCHSYHDPVTLDDTHKRKVEEILYKLGKPTLKS